MRVARVAGWALTGLAWGFGVLPRSAQLLLGRFLGWILLAFSFRKKVVLANLDRAYPGKLIHQNQILRASYVHLGQLIVEIFLIFGSLSRFVKTWVKLQGEENIQQALKKGRGIVFLASHCGNWEFMAAGGVVLARLNLMMVTKLNKPLWFHQCIEQARLKCGVKATYEPKTLRDVLAQLKKNGAVGVVLDQYVGPPVGVRVPVFGTPVGTSQLIATLAKRTGAAVLPVQCFRLADGSYILDVQPEVPWESHENAHYELAINTARYSKEIEKMIEAHPEQWLWSHRRFKGELGPLASDEWMKPRVRQ